MNWLVEAYNTNMIVYIIYGALIGGALGALFKASRDGSLENDREEESRHYWIRRIARHSVDDVNDPLYGAIDDY